jgi:hypothetical protein
MKFRTVWACPGASPSKLGRFAGGFTYVKITFGPGGESTMDKAIAKLNIQHFRAKLASELDPAKRDTLHRLLKEEEDKLAQITMREAELKRST